MIGLPRLGRKDGPMVGICVGHAMTHWYPGAFTVILPFFAQDLGLTLTQVGLLIGLRNVTGTLINLPGGMLVDIVGRRKLIMGLAIAWTGIPYLLLGLTYNFVLIALFLGVVGVGNLLFHPAALSSLSELYPTRRGFATAMHQLGASFGDTLGPFCIGIVLTWATWRQVTLANAIPGIVMSIIFWRLMRHVQLRRPRPAGRLALRSYMQAVSSLFKNANLVLLALLGGARSMTQSGLTVFLPIYLTTVSMLSPALVGTYMAIVQGAGIISGPMSGGLSDRFGRRPIVAAGMLSTSVMLIVMMVLNVEWLFVLVLALVGFFLYSISPVLNAWALDMAPPDLGGTSIGILFGAQALLGALAPVVGGALADAYGLKAAFYFIAASILAANLLVLAIKET
ncbi:MAG TPA: MFS transporter [Chloroflexota bacterium]|nr:MFS transporter [Chloroflexota bacterium]